ncbi:Mpo1 family 2-hydroxy fatty acid dioxygenase [Colwellia sp. MEBiC06753]
MKNIVEQLSNYKSVHLNKNNLKTHFIGIPAIIWAIALLLSLVTIELPFNLGGEQNISVPLAFIVGFGILIYYFILNVGLALMTALIFGPLIYSSSLVADSQYPVAIAVTVFVVGWIFQFIGHAYEKAKPAFFDDINQLLIGPLFVIAEIYFALGLNKLMDAEVHQKAVEKRKLFEQVKKAL